MTIFAAVVGTMLSATPNVGDVAPDFTVKDIDGNELTLSKLVEAGPVILAFFPKARTSG
jgi:peroxiredoxin